MSFLKAPRPPSRASTSMARRRPALLGAIRARQPRHPRPASGHASRHQETVTRYGVLLYVYTRRPHASSTSPPGPAVLPLPVLEEAQRDLAGAAGRRHVGARDQPSVDRRSKAFWRRPRPTCGRSRASRTTTAAVSPGRRQSAVLDGADEPAAAGRVRRLHRDRHLGAEGGRRKRRRSGAVNIAATTETDNFTRVPRQDEIQLTPGCGLRAHDVEQHHLRAPSGRSCPRSATRRSSATRRPTSSAGRSTSRAMRSSMPVLRRTSALPG